MPPGGAATEAPPAEAASLLATAAADDGVAAPRPVAAATGEGGAEVQLPPERDNATQPGTVGGSLLGELGAMLGLSTAAPPDDLPRQDAEDKVSCSYVHVATVCMGYTHVVRLVRLVKSILMHRAVPLHLHAITDAATKVAVTSAWLPLAPFNVP